MAGYGLRFLQNQHGRNVPKIDVYPVASATALFMGQPVMLDANGLLVTATAGGGADTAVVGVCAQHHPANSGVSESWPVISPWGSIFKARVDALTTPFDTLANFKAMRDSFGGANKFSFNAESGNTTTGISTVDVDVGSTDADKLFIVVDYPRTPDHVWGTSTEFHFKFNNERSLQVAAGLTTALT